MTKEPDDRQDEELSLTELIARRGEGSAVKSLSPAEAFFASAFVGLGLLMMGLCGLCTGLGLMMSVSMALGGYPMLQPLLSALTVGGIPIAIGYALYRFGRSLQGR